MSSSLAELSSQLQSDVAATSGVPTASQYAQAVKDAVADLGRRVPLTKQTTLSIVAGTASYALPADFLRLIRLAPTTSASGVLITSAGLVPVASRCAERVAIAGSTLMLTPTPAYTLERELRYAATYILDMDGDTYAELTDERAQIALLLARALALRLQANIAAPQSVRIETATTAKDRTKVVEALRGAAADWAAQYQAAIVSLVGAVGLRG